LNETHKAYKFSGKKEPILLDTAENSKEILMEKFTGSNVRSCSWEKKCLMPELGHSYKWCENKMKEDFMLIF
jgi:hypothetical protein